MKMLTVNRRVTGTTFTLNRTLQQLHHRRRVESVYRVGCPSVDITLVPSTWVVIFLDTMSESLDYY